MATPAQHLVFAPPPGRLRRFAVMWRDEDTARPQALAVCARSAHEAAEILENVLGHTNFELMEI